VAQPSDAVLIDDLAQKFLRAGGLTLDRFERMVFLPGNPAGIELSGIEFKLLQALMLHAGQALSREELLREVWKVDWPIDTNRLDVAVSYIRRKIGAARVETVRGCGYRLAA